MDSKEEVLPAPCRQDKILKRLLDVVEEMRFGEIDICLYVSDGKIKQGRIIERRESLG